MPPAVSEIGGVERPQPLAGVGRPDQRRVRRHQQPDAELHRRNILLEPARPRANEPVKLVIQQEALDVDGDALSYKVRWLRNGKDVTAQAKDREVAANVLKKGAETAK